MTRVAHPSVFSYANILISETSVSETTLARRCFHLWSLEVTSLNYRLENKISDLHRGERFELINWWYVSRLRSRFHARPNPGSS